MTILVSSQDRTKSVGAALATASATTIYTVPGVASKGVSISLCNITAATPVDVTVEWYDLSAAVAFKLMSTYTVAAKSFHLRDLGAIWMDQGDEVRVTASVASSLHAVLTVIEHHDSR